MTDVKTHIKQGGTLLFDGAMGTLFNSLPGRAEQPCENANALYPEEILSIHKAYLEAGCQAIKTNTFSVSIRLASGEEENCRRIVEAGCALAKEAAKPYGAIVFADLGPAPQGELFAPWEVYCKQVDMFLAQGVTHFLVETLANDDGISELAFHLKNRCENAYLIVSYAVSFDGITRDGILGQSLLSKTAALTTVDAVGFNCVCGPHHMLEYIKTLQLNGKVLSVMPNAGYPAVLGRRIVFNSDPQYFGEKMSDIAHSGAAIIGGCCGTTPEHILKTAQALLRDATLHRKNISAEPSRISQPNINRLAQKIESGQRVIAVEFDPPVDDDISSFMDCVSALKAAGVDAVTIADCPVGRPRADSSLLACKVKRELGIEPLPHLTCRDRNLNAIKALLLGLSIEGVHNVLLVTGDPLPTEYRDEVKSVFNFNSRKLARYVNDLNQHSLTTPFCIYGALNVNAINFDVQLRLALEKEACGIKVFLTQPVLSEMALENIKRARKTLSAKILGGIFPVVSYKNACFLNNEMSGMNVGGEIVAMYKDKTREQAEDIAVDISMRVAKEIKPYTDGYYIMTPFRRVELVKRIIEEIKDI